MDSRNTIISRIKENKPSLLPLPPSVGFDSDSSDLPLQFAEILASVGGQAIFVSDYVEIKSYIKTHFGHFLNIATPIAALSEVATFSLAIADPHDLETIDLAIVTGECAVSENAAIWVSDHYSPHRALLFITQYLAIVIKKSDIVANMHHAYRLVNVNETGWGCWVSGPSKTADIEQSLVIGAHGARGLTVFVM